MSLIRQSLIRNVALSRRTFTTTVRSMAEGDTGATRGGGAAQGDAFTKREQASEDYSIRQRELEKLKQLKKKIADSEAEVAKHRKEVDELQGKK